LSPFIPGAPSFPFLPLPSFSTPETFCALSLECFKASFPFKFMILFYSSTMKFVVTIHKFTPGISISLSKKKESTTIIYIE
jgi:hypothetical protein